MQAFSCHTHCTHTALLLYLAQEYACVKVTASAHCCPVWCWLLPNASVLNIWVIHQHKIKCINVSSIEMNTVSSIGFADLYSYNCNQDVFLKRSMLIISRLFDFSSLMETFYWCLTRNDFYRRPDSACLTRLDLLHQLGTCHLYINHILKLHGISGKAETLGAFRSLYGWWSDWATEADLCDFCNGAEETS